MGSSPLPFWRFTRTLKHNFSLVVSYFISSTFFSEKCIVMEPQENFDKLALLDLPDLALESIFQRLSPTALSNIACVCTTLRELCTRDHLWEDHMQHKWSKIIGQAAYRKWQRDIAVEKLNTGRCRSRNFSDVINMFRLLFRPVLSQSSKSRRTTLPVDSVMSFFLALESGRFWFPAQVYNRENGHAGFILSCYDAEVSYDYRTDSFKARYPSHGRRPIAIEHNISWARLRAPPVDTFPYDLHISESLAHLKPGDDIEIQWRRNQENPYGWWYGVVGHLVTCHGIEGFCLCHNSDSITLEFHQYSIESRWRSVTINWKDHRENGNEEYGFYGGIRTPLTNEEISTWKRLWPSYVLE